MKSGKVIRGTRDGYLLALDAESGRVVWERVVADAAKGETFTMPPVVFENRIIVGPAGNEVPIQGWVGAFSLDNGEPLWRFHTMPRSGEPGADTWTSTGAVIGGGAVWTPFSLDPDRALVFVPVGNPAPALNGDVRPGSNLYTNSLVVLDARTGKLVWYYQATPHDTHDWDAAQTPVLIDGIIDGRPRKLLAQANRNGYFFLLDRTNGQHILTTKHTESANWIREINLKGQPIGNPSKEATVPGTLVSPNTSGATNWPPPSFSPDTGLLYFGVTQTFSLLYLTDTDAHPQGWAAAERNIANVGSLLEAIDYKTGRVRWSRPLAIGPNGGIGGAMGLLSTAGNLLFGNDGGGSFVAYDASNGRPLWHAGLGTNTSNGPQTFLLDGRQYIVVGAGDALYAFALQ